MSIKLENLSLSLKAPAQSSPQKILKSVNLEIKKPEIFLVIGPSSSGKSVLLKTIAGLYPATEGHLFFYNRDLAKLNRYDRFELAKKVAMTFQRSGLFDSLTALENLVFPLQEVLKIKKKEAIERSFAMLHSVGLADQEHKFPHEMSGGMQKRLGIARALVIRPETLVCDDPTAGLDPVTSRSIMELILKEQAENQMALLMATSDIDLAFSVGLSVPSRMGFLSAGEFLFVGQAHALQESTVPVIRKFLETI